MPRSVYSNVEGGPVSRFNPINLVKRFAAVAVVMAMVLLGTATMASAAGTTATLSAVSFAPATSALRAGNPGTWTVTLTPSVQLAAGDVLNLAFPTGTSFASPVVTTGGGFAGFTATSTNNANDLAVALVGTPTSSTPASSTLTITNVTNPAAQAWPASDFTANVNGGTSANASSGVTIWPTSEPVPTAVNTGNGTASVTYTTDGSPVAVTGAYTLSASGGTVTTATNCPVYTNADTGGTATTHTCSVTGLTSGAAYTYSVTESGGSDPYTTAVHSAALVASSALATPVATVFGSGAVTVSFTSDGAANLYTVTSSPAAGECAIGGNPVAPGPVSCLVTGLTNGTSYTFTVTPSGGTTTSTVSAASNAVSPGAILGAPTLANAGANQVNASFSADGVATLYTVQAYTSAALTTPVSGAVCYVGNGTAPAKGTTLNCTVVGTSSAPLVTNSTYYFTVTPSGGNDTSAASPSSSITALASISAPTAVGAGNQAIAVSFTADGAATLYVVHTYTVPSGGTAVANLQCQVANATPPTGLQTCTVSGVTNGTTYYFDVTPSGGTTANGTTARSLGVSTSAALGTIAVATAGPGAIKVSFTPDGTATVYTVTANAALTAVPTTYSDCVVSDTTTPPSSSTTQSCTVTGLTPGGTYTFTVLPSGNGTTSAATTSLPITTTVGVGTPIATSNGSGAVKVTFGTDGVATTYVVTSSPGALTCTLTGTTALTGTQSCTVTGLTNGTSYTFTVTGSGNGSTTGTSVASNAVVAGAGLGTPTVATAGFGSVSVSFTADGVATLYTVQSYLAGTPTVPVGATCFVGNTTTPPKGAQSCTVTGLVNGDSYVFDVTPSGNNTSSSVSAKSASVIPTSALAIPTVANAGTGAIKVTFTADGVASAYTVATTTTGGSCVVANTTTPPTGVQTCTVTGLTNGSTYSFMVTPTGNGTKSTAATSAPILVGVNFLKAPTATWAASGAANVAFTADGVASTYVVTANLALSPYTASGTCTVANSTTPPTGSQNCTVKGLTNGVGYTFTVTPSGNATTSLMSPASAVFTAALSVAPPVAPTGVTATGAANSVVVTWVAPTNTGGSAITGYVVTASAANISVTCGTVAATATTCTVKGLLANTAYAVTVAAVTALGTSPVATASATTTGKVTPPPAKKVFRLGGVHGAAVHGRTVLISLSGTGFYGQPRVSSNAPRTRAVVTKDSGTLITIRITSGFGARGWHTLTVILGNGKSAKRNYRTN